MTIKKLTIEFEGTISNYKEIEDLIKIEKISEIIEDLLKERFQEIQIEKIAVNLK